MVMGAIRTAVLAACCAALTVAAPAVADPAAETLDVGEVNAVVADPALVLQPRAERSAPAATDPAAPGSCWAVSDEQAVFGADWTEFRAVAYGTVITATGGGKGFPTVTQAVGGYPGVDAARAVFDRLGPALSDCAAGNVDSYRFTLERPDPATLTLRFAGPARATVVYALRDATLIRVSALALDDSARIAQEVSARIGERVG